MTALSNPRANSYMLSEKHGETHMGSYADAMFGEAMILAGSGRYSTVSEIQAELNAQYPEARFLMFDERYSHKLTYIKELLHKHGKRR